MLKLPKCRCGQSVLPPSGPDDAKLACIVYEPAGFPTILNWLEPDGVRLLSNELHFVGLNYLTTRISGIWGHAPNENEKDFTYNLKRVLKDVREAEVVLLFGTDVTTTLLDKGISDIIGLRQTCPYLLGKVVIPVPHPTHTVNKPLGEFRLCLQKVARYVQRN